MYKVFLFSVLAVLSMAAGAQTPAGEIRGPFTWKSKIYPGTERDYWLYVPKQYNSSRAACVMVVEDGLTRAKEWKLPTVLDSLIALNEIPVIIGIFIDHGKVAASGTDNFPRFNRSFEYDALGDRHARFLLEEILPEVARTYNISKDPNDRSIAGASSGAIAAFNVAWERPNEFRRVFSTIGTYVGLRGGDEFSTLVRKVEPKPIRIFLADGSHDLNIYAGDWWVANQGMLTALTWAGYEVNHAWGDGGHNGKHGAAILPLAMKWLWMGYPTPVQAHKGPDRKVFPIVENEPWRELNTETVSKLAVNSTGEVFFTSMRNIFKIDISGNVSVFAKIKGEGSGLTFQEDGKLYVSDVRQHKIVVVNTGGDVKEVVGNVNADFLTASSRGIYFTETQKDRIGFYSLSSKKVSYITVPDHPAGLALSAEQTFLNVALSGNVLGYSFKINSDGSLTEGQEYVHFHIPYGFTTPGVTGMTVDEDNLLYTASSMGVQVSDQLGRVNFIMPLPSQPATDVKFGGTGFSTLYLACNGKLFGRKVSSKGVLSWRLPVKPPKPGL